MWYLNYSWRLLVFSELFQSEFSDSSYYRDEAGLNVCLQLYWDLEVSKEVGVC